MSIATPQEKALPRTLTGPLINGKATEVKIYTKAQLLASSCLPSLIQTLNKAFQVAHDAQPELGLGQNGGRISSVEHFVSYLDDHPSVFIIVVAFVGLEDVIATANCRRFFGTDPESDSPWVRRVKPEPGVDEWELKLMAVDPGIQKQGLAQYIMNLVEEEVTRESQLDFDRERLTQGAKLTTRSVKLVLNTPQEINGAFYEKRGYTTDYEIPPTGIWKCHIVFMSKIIATLSWRGEL
jgi:GNAT superfamily N-acetyltransferase